MIWLGLAVVILLGAFFGPELVTVACVLLAIALVASVYAIGIVCVAFLSIKELFKWLVS